MRLILLLLLVATSDMVFRPGVERCPLATLGCPLMILLLHEGPIEAFVPRLAFAILLGLSMDHEVFVTSRIPEEHVHGL